jgi:hypothetical protein
VTDSRGTEVPDQPWAAEPAGEQASGYGVPASGYRVPDAGEAGTGVFEEDLIVVATQESAGYDERAEPAADLPEPAADLPEPAEMASPASDAMTPVAVPDAAVPDAAVSDAAAPVAVDGQWSEIKAMFVDDPGESVQRAAGLVEQAIEGLMASVRQRQGSLASTWQEGDAAGTEALRTALRGYRGMYEQLEQMSGQFSAAAGS